MFFFTRRGYESEIKRLQLANNDLLAAQITLQEAHQKQVDSLLDRLMTFLEPGILRELRKVPSGPIPTELQRPGSKPKRIYRGPGTKVTSIPNIDWEKGREKDKEAVDTLMTASLGEGS